MTEELAQDMAQYKKASVKGIVVAARGIIKLLRQTAPELLSKRDRGRPGKREVEESESSEVSDTESAKPDGEAGEVTEEVLLDGSKVRKRTKEERLEATKEAKTEHKYRSRMEDKTAGFSDKEKLKTKPFMLTRFRKGAGHMQRKTMNALQKQKKRREGTQKAKFGK
jgi:protein SDA1